MYLRKVGTNEVFAFSPYLMQRGDMVPYTGPIPVPKDFEVPEVEITFMKYVQAAKEKRLNPNQYQGILPKFPGPEIQAPPPPAVEKMEIDVKPQEETPLKIEGEIKSEGAITAPGPDAAGGDYKMGAIVQAIKELDPEKDFTTRGVPRVEALADRLGIQVSMQERDLAWDAYREQQSKEQSTVQPEGQEKAPAETQV